MSSLHQLNAALVLSRQGFEVIKTPRTDRTPIPGVVLMMNDKNELILVKPDGSAIDLIAVERSARDLVVNGFDGNPALNKPAFIPDWTKATALAMTLQGKCVCANSDGEHGVNCPEFKG